jgi:ketosteroid isomerase-like protein
MSNAATVQGIYEAFGRGDIPAILDQLSDDVAWDAWTDASSAQSAGVPWLAERHGRDQVGGFFQSLSALEFHTFAPYALIEGGDRVVAQISVDLTVRETGRRFRDDEIHVWVFGDDGRVTEFRHYVDTGKHAAAAGRVPAGV